MLAAETAREGIRLGAEEYAAVERVLAASSWALGHVHQVARLAGRLFDALRPYHGLGPTEERLLIAGALLHDVGYPTDPEQHHKVSARMVRAQLGPPFSDDDVDVIALLTRYHRRACPKLRHQRYGRLSPERRQLVVWLGGILRVADGLDRAHEDAVGLVTAARTDGRIVLHVAPAGETAAPHNLLADDVRGAMRKRDLLERALGLSVSIKG